VFGDVDTYAHCARLIKERASMCSAPAKRLRARLSEEMTTGRGPSSKSANYVLMYVVADDRRDQVRERFAELYTAARNEPAPFAAPPHDRTEPDAAAQHHADQQSPPVGAENTSETTAEMRDLVAQLRELLTAAEAREAIPHRELDDRTHETGQLVGNVQALSLLARQPTRRRGRRSVCPSCGTYPVDTSGQDPVCPTCRHPLGERSATQTSAEMAGSRPSEPTSPTDGTRAAVPAQSGPRDAGVLSADVVLESAAKHLRVSYPRSAPVAVDQLEAYWCGKPWSDSTEVTGRFGDIAEELRREGVGTPSGPERTRYSSKRARQRRAARRVPRGWTSGPPRWLYAVAVLVLVVVLGLAYIAPETHQVPATDNDNPLVNLMQDQFPPSDGSEH
jgi:rubrerythrin